MTHAEKCGCAAEVDLHAGCTTQFCRVPLHSRCTATAETLTAGGPPAFIQKKIDAKKAAECDDDDEECKKKAKEKKGKAPFPGAKGFSAEADGEYDGDQSDCPCGDKKIPGEECDCDDEDDEFAAKSAVVDLRGEQLTRWRGLIAPVGVPTGDGRQFSEGALSHRDLPLALRWHRADSGGHQNAVVIGTLDEVTQGDDGGVYAGGVLFDPDPTKLPQLAQDVAEARLLMEQGVIGPSVDLDDMEYSVEEAGEMAAGDTQRRQKVNVTKGRISGVTMVQIPAFSETHGGIELYQVDAATWAAEKEARSAVVSSAVSDVWSGLEVWSLSDWSPAGFAAADENTLLASCAYQGDEGLLFPIVEEVEGQQVVVLEAVTAALAALRDGAVPTMDPVDRLALVERLEWLLAPEEQPAALVAGAAPVAPPVAWFADPKLNGPTGLTVTEDGRVFGHLATWGTCHVGFPGACVTPPQSASAYAYFHVGEVITAEGQEIPVGKVTIGPGHADTRLGFQAAAEHYDSAGTCAAVVRAGEDGYGIWVAGAVTNADPAKLAELRRSPLSGDWRNVGGRLELVAALAVNTPGFPVPRARTKNGKGLALVAAGALHVGGESGGSGANAQPFDHSTLAIDVARTMRRMDRADRLAATVGGAFASGDRIGRAFAAARLVQGRKG